MGVAPDVPPNAAVPLPLPADGRDRRARRADVGFDPLSLLRGPREEVPTTCLQRMKLPGTGDDGAQPGERLLIFVASSLRD